MLEDLRSILWRFKAPIRYAMAYGSGVFPQASYSPSSKPQIDLLLGVTYSQHFHDINLSQNFHHYSSLRRLGSGAIARVQEDFGAGAYFNPYVSINGFMVKYGVISIDEICDDLTSWKTLYIAGRMHKPTLTLRDDPRVKNAVERNYYSAIRTALLLLPERFSERELFMTIAGLSYLGDPRMSFGENPRKVENIVTRQEERFRGLYAPYIAKLPNVQYSTEDTLIQDLDPVKRGNMVRRLPIEFRAKLYYQYRRKFGTEAALEEGDDSSAYGSAFDQQIARDAELSSEVARSIKATVAWPSTSQSIKGILTAGPLKSWRYSLEKLKKARS